MYTAAWKKIFTALLATLIVKTAFAQNLPDASNLLREIERSTGKNQLAPAPLAPIKPAPVEIHLPKNEGETIFVAGFRIKATRFSETELQDIIKEYTQRELTLEDLQAASRKISDYYRQHDYLAHAYLPPQTIQDGIVEIVVVEATLGQIKLDPTPGSRLNPTLAAKLVEAWTPLGKSLRPGVLDEAIASLKELPGVLTATSVLEAGSNPDESDILLHIEDGPLTSGSLTIDNTGSKGTGPWQLSLSNSLNNPFGDADQIQWNALKSEGSFYNRIGFSRPLGSSGLIGGINASFLNYQVLKSVSTADLNGTSFTSGMTLSYPLRRHPNFSLTATAGMDYKEMTDRMANSHVGDKRINVGYLGLSSTLHDDWFGGGTNRLSAKINIGDVDLTRNVDQYKGDQAAARTNGGYSKLNITVSRENPITETMTWLANLQGQWANGNLDGSEKFALGGLYGVHAYPGGEGSGDAGWMLNLQSRWQVADNLQFSGFYDLGRVRQHFNPWNGWQTVPGQPNTYSLQSLGIGLQWLPETFIQTQLTVARALNGNPGHDAAGNDSDGSNDKWRTWMQVVVNY